MSGVDPFETHVDRYEAWFEAHRCAYALMVTTICFLDDVEAAFREVRRGYGEGGFVALRGMKAAAAEQAVPVTDYDVFRYDPAGSA